MCGGAAVRLVRPPRSVPLRKFVSERSTPELQYLEARWASLVSYALMVRALHDFLPVDEVLNISTVRRTTLDVARRSEAELGPEQPMFIEGCQAQWDDLPRPDLPLTVGLDGGHVHSSQQRSRKDGWFEVIAGKSMPTDGPAKCFGFVQTYDAKPKRRLFEVLRSQGMQPNQQVTFLTDGGEDVRDLPLYLNRQAEHCLDWLCPCQRELHPELWGEISEWRDHLECVRGVRRQRGGQQTHGEEATGALDARGCPPALAGSYPDP